MEASNIVVLCAVQRHCFPAGANPARQLSLRSYAVGAVVEATKAMGPMRHIMESLKLTVNEDTSVGENMTSCPRLDAGIRLVQC